MYRATGYSSPLKVTFGQFSNRPLWNMYEMACEIAGGLKYFMVFQLGSKPIVFHLEFHEIKLRGKYGTHRPTPAARAEACGPTLTLGGLLPASVICGPCDHGASWVVQKSTFAIDFPSDPTANFRSTSGKVLAKGLPWTM